MKRDLPIWLAFVSALVFAFIFRSAAAVLAAVSVAGLFYLRDLIPVRHDPTAQEIAEIRETLNALALKAGMTRPFSEGRP